MRRRELGRTSTILRVGSQIDQTAWLHFRGQRFQAAE
jgi:hypothetical protein